MVTVPHGGWLRRLCRTISTPYEAAKGNGLLRRLTGKAPLPADGRSRRAARVGTVAAWHPQLALSPDGWSFYEYEFNRRQVDAFLTETGFEVKDSFAAFTDEGLYHSFGRLAGSWNAQDSRVDLTIVGKLLRAALPTSVSGHMLCFVVTKPA